LRRQFERRPRSPPLRQNSIADREILVKSTHITSGKRKVMQPTAEDLSNVEIVITPTSVVRAVPRTTIGRSAASG